MTDDTDDPYDNVVDFPPAGGKGGRKKAGRKAFAPGEAGEGCDDLDVQLAFKPLNDFGNAMRLVRRFGDDLMYVENVGWFAWDGARWDREHGMAEAVKRGHRIGQAIVGEAKALEEEYGKDYADRADALFKWAIQTGNTARVHGMLAAAQPYLAVPIDLLDAEVQLLAAPNVTIELRATCTTREPSRQDRQTRVLGVEFVPGAEAPRWNKFLEEVQPDPEMRAFIQRFMGYCLTGLTIEHKFAIFYGVGRNGKTVFINMMRHVFHLYAMSLPAATILAKPNLKTGSEATPDLADLPGVRLVTVAEPPEGGRLDESRVKEMTGGEYRQKVRELNKGFFEFIPRYKIVMATNYRPVIRGTDRGIWSRVLLVPWTTQLSEEQIDPNLETKLREEGPGILQWLLTGAEDYLANGLEIPEKVKQAVKDYQADEDQVGEFLKARCEVCPESINPATGKPFEVSSKRLREVYLEWCKEEGLDALTGKTFGVKLAGRGITKRKTGGNTVYVGLHVNADTIPEIE